MKSFTLAACVAVAAASNNVPIFGSYPGYIEGGNKTGIDLELYFDILCGDCKREMPTIEAFLASPWLDSTVQD